MEKVLKQLVSKLFSEHGEVKDVELMGRTGGFWRQKNDKSEGPFRNLDNLSVDFSVTLLNR